MPMATPCLDSAPREPVRVELGERSYLIHIRAGLLAEAGRLIAACGAPDRVFIITHPVVDRLHGDRLRQGMGELRAEMLYVPAGERQKSLRRAAALYDELLARGADRASCVIAFGGGVIGDLAGFVAATYMRGIAYAQVPTTLLAQVDSSVGGKVAVDHPRAKNLIGAFYQPRVVIADPQTLKTLPARDYRGGLAEAVKHAVIADAELFAWMEQNVRPLRRRAPEAISRVVRRSCEIKADVVSRDERESGLRAILNLGHTVGHALETLSGYRSLRHGEAVAVGMIAACRISERVGGLPAAQADRVERLLAALGLPTRTQGQPAGAILSALTADKKAVGGRPRFVLPRALGAVEAGCEVDPALVRSVLVDLGAGA
jgi:3-dehydroquinate synthase